MKKVTRRTMFAIVIVLALFVGMGTLYVDAKTSKKTGWVTKSGNTYYYKNGKPKTGYFKVKGKTYYGHKTSSAKYPKGSVTKGQMRIKNGKWYAFGTDGARYDKDKYVRKGRKKYIELDIRSRNNSVRYVYSTARTQLGRRYSTARKRYQVLGEDDEWHTVEGMQFIPIGWVDNQR